MHVVMLRLLLAVAAAQVMVELEHRPRQQDKPEQQLLVALQPRVRVHHVLQPLVHFS
jgi:hypothetical protein